MAALSNNPKTELKTKAFDYVVPIRYVVMLGESMYGFSKVSNLSTSIEYEVIQEGGVNDYAYALPKPSSDIHKLMFEKGYRILDKNDRASLGRWSDRPGAICIIGRDAKVKKIWGFTSGYISKWELSDLSAEQSTLLYEKIELIHNGLSEFTLSQSNSIVSAVEAQMASGKDAG